MKIKEKIKDWHDDLKYEYRHIKGNIRSFSHFIGRWFSYCKVLREAYDFDYRSILDVERHQLIRVRNTISKYHDYEGWEHDVYWINIALKLFEIIVENDSATELIGEGFITKPYKDGLHEVVEDPNSKWVLIKYVNTSNYKRFFPQIEKEDFDKPNIGNILKDSLRREKAWYLYHKLKFNKMRHWWV